MQGSPQETGDKERLCGIAGVVTLDDELAARCVVAGGYVLDEDVEARTGTDLCREGVRDDPEVKAPLIAVASVFFAAFAIRLVVVLVAPVIVFGAPVIVLVVPVAM
jgi:hypothetical protein